MGFVTADPDCLFCKIIAGAIPAQIVHDGERTFAFRDIHPQAPLHVLVVPRDHAPNAAATAESDATVFAEIALTARAIAAAEGYDDYRLVFNTGPGAGQTVFHTHAHVLAGGPLPMSAG